MNLVNYQKVAAIGKKTAEYCQSLDISVDFIPKDYSQEGFINQFSEYNQFANHSWSPSSLRLDGVLFVNKAPVPKPCGIGFFCLQ